VNQSIEVVAVYLFDDEQEAWRLAESLVRQRRMFTCGFLTAIERWVIAVAPEGTIPAVTQAQAEA
jgi:hypothetical protein